MTPRPYKIDRTGHAEWLRWMYAYYFARRRKNERGGRT